MRSILTYSDNVTKIFKFWWHIPPFDFDTVRLSPSEKKNVNKGNCNLKKKGREGGLQLSTAQISVQEWGLPAES